MKGMFKELIVKIHAVSVRERFILMLAVLAVIFMLNDTFLLSPLGKEKQKLITEKQQWQDKINTLAKETEELSAKNRFDPNEQTRAQLARLAFELGKLDGMIKLQTGGIIEPAQMSEVIKDLLKRETGLKLAKLQNLQGEPLLDSKDKKSDSKDKDSKKPGEEVYRHGLAIEFEGGYLQTIDYLKIVEKLPWHIYWDEIAFSVVEYPLAHVKITVYSLSLTDNWIGV